VAASPPGRGAAESDAPASARDHAWRRPFAGASALLIGGVVALLGVLAAAAPALDGLLGREGRTAAGVVLALVPALLWLSVFAAHDREHPEPKVLLLQVFVLGALVAAAVGQPVIERLFRVGEWADGSPARLLAGALVVGVVQESVKYAAVRHSVYRSRELDQPIDGIVYAAAAGLGYAAFLGIDFAVRNLGASLAVVAARDAVDTLGQASFAGVTGYFLGRAKFERKGLLWLPAGLGLAAALNAVVSVGLGAVSRSGLERTPLRGLALAAAVAGATSLAVLRLMRRGRPPGDVPVPSEARREVVLWALVLAALLAGWQARASVLHATRGAESDGVAFRAPARFEEAEAGHGVALRLSDASSARLFPTEVVLRRLPEGQALEGPRTLEEAVSRWTTSGAERGLLGYTVAAIAPRSAAGRPAFLVEYGYVAPPPAAAPPSALPTVVRAEDLLFEHRGRWHVLTFAADDRVFPEERPAWQDVLSSLALR
jgi:RsiW-degrading membrane proteinase PrsW (M82 family)